MKWFTYMISGLSYGLLPVLPSFTEFYRVLPSFIGFSGVQLGYKRLLNGLPSLIFQFP